MQRAAALGSTYPSLYTPVTCRRTLGTSSATLLPAVSSEATPSANPDIRVAKACAAAAATAAACVAGSVTAPTASQTGCSRCTPRATTPVRVSFRAAVRRAAATPSSVRPTSSAKGAPLRMASDTTCGSGDSAAGMEPFYALAIREEWAGFRLRRRRGGRYSVLARTPPPPSQKGSIDAPPKVLPRLTPGPRT